MLGSISIGTECWFLFEKILKICDYFIGDNQGVIQFFGGKIQSILLLLIAVLWSMEN